MTDTIDPFACDWGDGYEPGANYIKTTSGDDIVTGTDGADLVLGRGGDDRLRGGLGNDALYGQAGDDVLDGDEGDDWLDGGDGEDILRGGAGNDRMRGQDGDDRLEGGDGDDCMEGNDGDDFLNGQDGKDLLFGGAGNDEIRGGAGKDVAFGGSGRDKILGGSGDDVLQGDGGNDHIHGGDGDDKLTGGEGRDRLIGADGDDTIFGEDDDDVLVGFAGDDTLDGGDGDDIARGGVGEDKLFGGAGDDRLEGGADNDRLDGADGKDFLAGGDGDDRLTGGDGDDMLRGNDGADFGEGGDGNDVVIGGDGNDVLDGGDGKDVLHGNDGDDKLSGDAGDDRLIAGGGRDNLSGGDGDDVLDGGADEDTISGGAGDDVIRGGSGMDIVMGGEGDDRIAAGEGNDLVDGGEGDDFIAGQDGDDRLAGGVGDDEIRGDGGRDLIDGGEGDDNLFGGDGDDGILGGDGLDCLDGGRGNDFLDGGAGDDLIIGGGGDDMLFGGDGRDAFVFRPGHGHNKISDFDAAGGDVLDIAAFDPADVLIFDVLDGALITLGGNTDVLLLGVDSSVLTDDVFVDGVYPKDNQNLPPIAKDDMAMTWKNEPVRIDVLANDRDPDGDALEVLTNVSPENGSARLNADGTFTYTPRDGFMGRDFFDYVVSDGNGGTDTGRVYIDVKPPPNAPPVAKDDYAVTWKAEAVRIDVLANDRDPDGDALQVLTHIEPENGSAVVNSDGTVTYTPRAGFVGDDYFDYVVSDGNGGTDTGRAFIHVKAPPPNGATIVGASEIHEGSTKSYKVQLERAAKEDTYVTVNAVDMGAHFESGDTYGIGHQDIMWGGFYSVGYSPHHILYYVHGRVPNGTSISSGDRPMVGPKFATWDYSTFKDGHAVGPNVTLKIEAGQTMSDAFEVTAWKEKITTDLFIHSYKDGKEKDEFFKLSIADISGDHAVVAAGDDLKVEINDKSFIHRVSPIAFDMDGDGEIGVTGETTSYQKRDDDVLGETVSFDIDGDGAIEEIEWLDGAGDALLVDTAKIGDDGAIDGSALFGDDGGAFATGYEKLATLDANGDGFLAGAELAGLAVWADDGDAVLEDGELMSLAEAGVAMLAVEFQVGRDDEGRELLQSFAIGFDGQAILTEDVWFGLA